MQVTETPFRDVKLIHPSRYTDNRGWFAETFHEETFRSLQLPHHFVQDNQSSSRKGTLRGLHYQLEHPQGKLVRVLSGHIWDVVVDLRSESPEFGRWAGFHLVDDLQMLWIPEGFAHGFAVLSDTADVLYKVTRPYYPAGERCLLWNDPELAIEWPLAQMGTLLISPKDAQGTPFSAAELPRAISGDEGR